MERLTKRGKNGGVYFPEELVGVTLTPDNATIHRLLWRLAAYEDVGLEPAEVISMQGEWRAMMAALNSIGGGYGRLRELAEADKDERVVVLPCKPGDTVYSIFGAEVIEKTVGRVIINGYTTPRIWVDLDCSFLSSVTKRWDLGIGKDFFLTREEAEKALEAMKDD
jgi:hypothetical protein